MTRPTPHHELLAHHHDEAAGIAIELAMDFLSDGEHDRKTKRGVVHALLALVNVQRGQLRELKRLRRLLEHHHHPGGTVSLNLTGRLVPKQGGDPMPAGPFNPTDTDDVQFQIDPRNAAGDPTSGPFNWTLSDAAAGTLNVAADTKSAKLVTATGAIDCIVAVSDPRTGVSDTAAVQRVAPPPPDNNTTIMNLAGAVVPKA